MPFENAKFNGGGGGGDGGKRKRKNGGGGAEQRTRQSEISSSAASAGSAREKWGRKVENRKPPLRDRDSACILVSKEKGIGLVTAAVSIF